MNSREKCPKCLRPTKSCYCAEIKPYHTNIEILIIRHHKEKLQAFNTAIMAEHTFSNLKILDTDSPNLKEEIKYFIEKHDPFLLYFDRESKLLDTKKSELRNFIILDGTWSQTANILQNNIDLQSLKRMHINSKNLSLLKGIRTSCCNEHISTFEAIVKAVEILETSNLEEQLSPLKFLVREQKKYML